MTTLSRRRFLLSSASVTAAAGLGAPVYANTLPRVVATTGMIGDAVSTLGADLVEVKTLMGPGVDPHAYRQTRTDIVALSRADMVFWNGHYLEAQLEDLLLKLGNRTQVLAVAENVPDDLLLRHEDYANRADPHLWMVPDLWTHAVSAIGRGLQELVPDNADVIADRTESYMSAMSEIGAYAAEALSGVPSNSRVLVTAHDAFGYFGRAYGFDVMGIQGISTESEAGLQRIGALVDTLVERKISAVFVESSISDRNVRALIEGAAARNHTVRIGGELYSDAMGAPGTYEGTYIGMIDHNATTIASALGADVPPRGFNGKLSAGI